MSTTTYTALALLAVLALAAAFWIRQRGLRATPPQLTPGSPLPDLVSNLTQHYRSIIDLGAKLVLITPKPLETTRRVAEFFNVDFDFWLDDELAITRQLGLLLEGGIPGSYKKEYGKDTIWPTALVVDGAGIIS
jgi:hypothetical protein